MTSTSHSPIVSSFKSPTKLEWCTPCSEEEDKRQGTVDSIRLLTCVFLFIDFTGLAQNKQSVPAKFNNKTVKTLMNSRWCSEPFSPQIYFQISAFSSLYFYYPYEQLFVFLCGFVDHDWKCLSHTKYICVLANVIWLNVHAFFLFRL